MNLTKEPVTKGGLDMGRSILVLILLCSVYGRTFGVDLSPGNMELMRKSADDALQEAKKNPQLHNAGTLVFEYKDALLATGQKKEAMDYLVKGLEIDPWRLDQQLVLADLYRQDGKTKKARNIDRYVLQFSEKEEERETALKDLDKPSEIFTVPKAQAIPGTGPVVVLVPLGEVDSWILGRLSAEIHFDLGLPVSIMKLDLDPGPTDHDPLTSLLKSLREDVQKDPVLKSKTEEAFAKRKKTKKGPQKGLWDEGTFVPYLEQAFIDIGKPDMAQQVRALMVQVKYYPQQHDAPRLRDRIKDKAGPYSRPGVVFLGVAPFDIGADGVNYLFGFADKGAGVISYWRFTARYNQETPNNLRLIRRLEKQALSSIGFTYGVVRCSAAWCARAYPNNLEEHDAKENKLCDQCRKGFHEVFAKYGFDFTPPTKADKHDPDL